MQLTIENVEHLTLTMSDKPSGARTDLANLFVSSLFAGGKEGRTPDNKGSSPATAAPVHAYAQTAGTPAIGERWAEHGGVYAGVARGFDGEGDGHLILLDDKPVGLLSWTDAVKWAADLGNDARLPTRFESALLYANVQDQMETDRWHWTGTQYSDLYAWSQLFDDGSQISTGKSYEARCRAVRRLIL